VEWFKPSLRLFFTFVQSVELTLNQNQVAAPNKFYDLSMYEEGNNFRNSTNGNFSYKIR